MNQSGSVRAFEGSIEMMSELFFASLEPGNNYTTEPIILNTALYYALGYSSGLYVNAPLRKKAKKQNPTYVEDTASIISSLYVSVARPVRDIRYASEITNARGDEYIQYNQPEKQMNSPTGKYGVRKQILPGAVFQFFILSFDGIKPELPAYVRIGKKRAKACLTWTEMGVEQKSGDFLLNHPVLIEDLKDMPSRDIMFKRMQPFDVMERGRFSGGYLVLTHPISGEKTVFPSNIRFLQRMRM